MSPKPFGTALSMGAVLMPAIPWRCPQGSFPRKRLRGRAKGDLGLLGNPLGPLLSFLHTQLHFLMLSRTSTWVFRGLLVEEGGVRLSVYIVESLKCLRLHTPTWGRCMKAPLPLQTPLRVEAALCGLGLTSHFAWSCPSPACFPPSLSSLPENIRCSSIPTSGSSAGGADLRQLHPQKGRLAG